MAPPALLISGLRFAYRSDEGGEPFALRIGRLELERAEQVLLTAGSGQGKSTLLSIIAGLLEPDAGTVAVAGQNIHALRAAGRDRFRGRHIGMIFQTFNLLHGFSALENVMAALKFSETPRREHRQRAAALLEHLGISRPGATPERLSVGQQQRVAVARAVACAPELVLADEPTASLDPANAGAAIGLIQSACAEAGSALLCVSHDPRMAERFARRITLDELAEAAP
ncbi:MAG: ABC transporter ATP-binding protein [Phycisphaerales bacterium JB039]